MPRYFFNIMEGRSQISCGYRRRLARAPASPQRRGPSALARDITTAQVRADPDLGQSSSPARWDESGSPPVRDSARKTQGAFGWGAASPSSIQLRPEHHRFG
jgi:hypothetical protein